MWLIAIGLAVALLVGLVEAGQVRDPRLTHEPTATPCVPTAVERNAGVSYIWSFCP